MIEDGFIEGAPFSWVGIIIREGLKNDPAPASQRIDKTDGELPLTIEIDVHRLIEKTKQEMQTVYEETLLRCLQWTGRKFDRPMAKLEMELARLETSNG